MALKVDAVIEHTVRDGIEAVICACQSSQSFPGFYCPRVHGYSKIAKPLRGNGSLADGHINNAGNKELLDDLRQQLVRKAHETHVG